TRHPHRSTPFPYPPLFRSRGFDSIAYGVNLDDQGDFRPGQRAAEQHRVAAPLRDAGLTKQEIRELSRAAGLRIWDKPASACLSRSEEHTSELQPPDHLVCR